MRTWITTIGTSPFAVINTLWAACKSDEYVPDNVIWIINKQINSDIVETVKDWTSEILIAYGVKKPVINDILVDETDVLGLRDTIYGAIHQSKKTGAIAIDMTPGRKYMSAIAMQSGIAAGADKIYYLFLSDPRYQDTPFPLIPTKKQRLIEMSSEFGGVV
jgi:CRISPR/Cas system-associated protein Csm6